MTTFDHGGCVTIGTLKQHRVACKWARRAGFVAILDALAYYLGKPRYKAARWALNNKAASEFIDWLQDLVDEKLANQKEVIACSARRARGGTSRGAGSTAPTPAAADRRPR